MPRTASEDFYEGILIHAGRRGPRGGSRFQCRGRLVKISTATLTPAPATDVPEFQCRGRLVKISTAQLTLGDYTRTLEGFNAADG